MERGSQICVLAAGNIRAGTVPYIFRLYTGKQDPPDNGAFMKHKKSDSDAEHENK